MKIDIEVNKKKKRSILTFLKNKISSKCPECKGIMQMDFYDNEIDCFVYKCEKCGKRFF